MTRRALAGLVALAFACSSPPPPPPPPPPPVCCPPTPTPECCMRLGGTQTFGSCPGLTCDIPDPATPGWKLSSDVNGCAIWIVPPGPIACGAPPVSPVEAGPPCAPVNVASFTPSTMTPPTSPSSACTAQEIADFYDACLTGGMSSAACAALESPDGGGDAGSACTACLVSKAADATWGPVVVSPTHVKVNVAGCIALVQNDASPTSCAERASDESQCEAYACDAVCPVSPDGGALDYTQCTQEAAAGDCRPYLDAECSPQDAGLSACTSGASKAGFVALASVFCGGS